MKIDFQKSKYLLFKVKQDSKLKFNPLVPTDIYKFMVKILIIQSD